VEEEGGGEMEWRWVRPGGLHCRMSARVHEFPFFPSKGHSNEDRLGPVLLKLGTDRGKHVLRDTCQQVKG
jgi:hypothetical protein